MVNETAEKPAKTLIEELWSNCESCPQLGSLDRHALGAISCLDSSCGEETHQAALKELIGLFSAERAFLFLCDNDLREEVSALSSCIASRDLDGDPVSNPEQKAPRELLEKAVRNARPCLVSEGREETSSTNVSHLALPAASRDSVHFVLLLENRFRGLDLKAANLALALVYCRALAAGKDLAGTLEENESLWRELCRLREEAGENKPTEASPKPAEKKRDGLTGNYSAIIGRSPRMVEILQVIDRLAKSCAPVLINGESGTGKELAAMALHQNSPRNGQAFVSENCGALTETLLESELFGYVKGAFTGASKNHKGLFEQASGGSFFLDEVGDMSPSMQKKLLRVLQEGIIRRVGSKEFTPVDVRIISATNKDLLEECKAGHFREDLYYRLNVINLALPPLRDRREDIPELVDYFLRSAKTPNSKPVTMESAAVDTLAEYSWPGNIRQLQNETLKLAALCDENHIRVKDLSEHLQQETSCGNANTRLLADGFSHLSLREATEELEKELIRQALSRNAGNKSLVAKSLHIPKTTLYNKIKRYSL